MKVTAKTILVTLMAVIILSLIAAIVMPAIIIFIDSGELNFCHLQDLSEFVVASFVFGPPILTSGTMSFLAFIIMKDRLDAQKSALIASGSFIILSILLTILAFQAFIQGIMFIFESIGS